MKHNYIILCLILFLVGFIIVWWLIVSNIENMDQIANMDSTQKYTAIIVEPREHKALLLVVQSVFDNFPGNQWSVIIYHGTKNAAFVQNLLDFPNALGKYKDRITLVNLQVDNMTIPEYSRLLVSKSFYDPIQTEMFLIFQTDSIICKEYAHLITQFMEYDYVGAPWKPPGINNSLMGNGGLSLRRKSKMLELIDKCPYIDELPEDQFFCVPCSAVTMHMPTPEQAQAFSVEQIYTPYSFGVHKPWNYLTNEQMKTKQEHCSNLDKLVELQK